MAATPRSTYTLSSPSSSSSQSAESEFGDLVLILGDSLVPQRCTDIPAQFKQIFSTTKCFYKYILITGNCGSNSMLNYFKSLASNSTNIMITRGDQDFSLENTKEIKEHLQVKLNNNYSLLLLHGHTVVPTGDTNELLSLTREYTVDIVVSGHTHQSSICIDSKEKTSKLLLNPGSISGAYSSFSSGTVPSFIIMGVKQNLITVFLYELIGSQVKVTKSEFNKFGNTASTEAAK